MQTRMRIALGPLPLLCEQKSLWLLFRDCKNHVDYMSQVDKGTTSRFAQMFAHLFARPFIRECVKGWVGQPAGAG